MSNLSKYRQAGELETTITAKLLYLVLEDTVDEDGKVILAQRRVSDTLGISRSTISKNFRKLYRRGYIDIVPQFNEYGGRLPNRYQMIER